MQSLYRSKRSKGTLTETTHSSDVVCGKCNEGGVKRLVLLVMVQDLRFTAKEKGTEVSQTQQSSSTTQQPNVSRDRGRAR